MAQSENTISLDLSLYVAKEFKFTKENIDDLMVAALEGGINYWAVKAIKHKEPTEDLKNVNMASDYISRGGELIIVTIDGEKLPLNHENFMKGLEMVIRDLGSNDAEEFMDNHDADTADQIIQYALFNEIVYC
ncbi:MAG: hypothetical protein ACOC2U_04115 [bacterium]